MKQKFNVITSSCIPLPLENVDTDQIIPARFLKAIDKEGMGDNLFRDWRYNADGTPKPDFVMNDPSYSGVILVAGKNFGSGSSREHAAMEPRFLNVKVILAKSFARIHETNLKKQGMLALTFCNKDDYNKVQEDDRISLTGLKEFAPGSKLTVTLKHQDGSEDSFQVEHTYNDTQIAWFKAGSALNFAAKK